MKRQREGGRKTIRAHEVIEEGKVGMLDCK